MASPDFYRLRSRHRLRHAAWFAGLALVSSCSLGPETWEPHVLGLEIETNGTSTRVSLEGGPPILQLDPGDELQITGLRLALLPTRRSKRGSMVIQVREVPEVPASAVKLEARVFGEMRKRENGRPCYDERDRYESDWFAVQSSPWEAHDRGPSWILGGNWDEIRISVQVRPSPPTNLPDRYMVNVIMLEPSDPASRLRRNVGQNIFSRLADSFLGDKLCSD